MTLKDWQYLFVSVINLLTISGSSKHDLSAHKDQNHNLWVHDPINQPWENLRFIVTKCVVSAGQSLEHDGETNITAAYDVLNLEFFELDLKSKVFDRFSELFGSCLGLLFRLCSSADHLA